MDSCHLNSDEPRRDVSLEFQHKSHDKTRRVESFAAVPSVQFYASRPCLSLSRPAVPTCTQQCTTLKTAFSFHAQHLHDIKLAGSRISLGIFRHRSKSQADLQVRRHTLSVQPLTDIQRLSLSDRPSGERWNKLGPARRFQRG